MLQHEVGQDQLDLAVALLELATAAALVVCQVREVVPAGALDPEAVVTPGIYVDRVVAA